MSIVCRECGEDSAFEWHVGRASTEPALFIGCMVCSETVRTYDDGDLCRFLTATVPVHEGLPDSHKADEDGVNNG